MREPQAWWSRLECSRCGQLFEIVKNFPPGPDAGCHQPDVRPPFAHRPTFFMREDQVMSEASLPSRERGSKPHQPARTQQASTSLPSRERGSKHVTPVSGGRGTPVAPFTGARIETTKRRPPTRTPTGRSLHGSADRNECTVAGTTDPEVAPFTGARIETTSPCPICIGPMVAPFTGARIETRPTRSRRVSVASLPSRERGSKPKSA
jgi:hypothetical protein